MTNEEYRKQRGIETLKQIKGFPKYWVSNFGRVWSSGYGWLKPKKDRNGHLQVCLYSNKKRFSKYVHRLVLETFKGKCPKGMEGCHNDGNTFNNHINNLRWDTSKNNTKDSIKHGTYVHGETHGNSILTEDEVKHIITMCRSGQLSYSRVANIYGISKQCVVDIATGRTWKHIERKDYFKILPPVDNTPMFRGTQGIKIKGGFVKTSRSICEIKRHEYDGGYDD